MVQSTEDQTGKQGAAPITAQDLAEQISTAFQERGFPYGRKIASTLIDRLLEAFSDSNQKKIVEIEDLKTRLAALESEFANNEGDTKTEPEQTC